MPSIHVHLHKLEQVSYFKAQSIYYVPELSCKGIMILMTARYDTIGVHACMHAS